VYQNALAVFEVAFLAILFLIGMVFIIGTDNPRKRILLTMALLSTAALVVNVIMSFEEYHCRFIDTFQWIPVVFMSTAWAYLQFMQYKAMRLLGKQAGARSPNRREKCLISLGIAQVISQIGGIIFLVFTNSAWAYLYISVPFSCFAAMAISSNSKEMTSLSGYVNTISKQFNATFAEAYEDYSKVCIMKNWVSRLNKSLQTLLTRVKIYNWLSLFALLLSLGFSVYFISESIKEPGRPFCEGNNKGQILVTTPVMTIFIGWVLWYCHIPIGNIKTKFKGSLERLVNNSIRSQPPSISAPRVIRVSVKKSRLSRVDSPGKYTPRHIPKIWYNNHSEGKKEPGRIGGASHSELKRDAGRFLASPYSFPLEISPRLEDVKESMASPAVRQSEIARATVKKADSSEREEKTLKTGLPPLKVDVESAEKAETRTSSEIQCSKFPEQKVN